MSACCSPSRETQIRVGREVVAPGRGARKEENVLPKPGCGAQKEPAAFPSRNGRGGGGGGGKCGGGGGPACEASKGRRAYGRRRGSRARGGEGGRGRPKAISNPEKPCFGGNGCLVERKHKCRNEKTKKDVIMNV